MYTMKLPVSILPVSAYIIFRNYKTDTLIFYLIIVLKVLNTQVYS